MAQCVVIDLEADKRGVILSLECEYDSHGGPSDQLRHSQGLVLLRLPGSSAPLSKVMTIRRMEASALYTGGLIELTSRPPVQLSGLTSGR